MSMGRPTEYNGYSKPGCLTEDGGVTAAQAALDAEIAVTVIGIYLQKMNC